MYTLKKSLGQHFLHDENICRKIVSQLEYKSGLHLLEIGPGGGALTKYLISIDNIEYKAIEIDEEKVLYLKKAYPIVSDKIIPVDFLQSKKPYDSRFTIIGNFPYNISTQIVFKILDWEEDVTNVIAMFQKEVGQRIAAHHGNKTYGILSVLVQSYFKVDYLFDVNENCFTPPPKVKSGVIKLSNLNNPYNIVNKKLYTKMIKAAFGQRRKTLRNAIHAVFPHVNTEDEIFNKRAEQLSVSEFVTLYKTNFNDEA